MTTTTSTKFRAIGGASVLALTAGLSVPAFAQEEDGAAPAPTAPAVPANVEECEVADGTLTCRPGVDPDGIFFADADGSDDDTDDDDSIALDIQSGAYVQGAVVAFDNATGVVDGAIVTTDDFDGALLLGEGSDVTINGFVQTGGDQTAAVEALSDSTLENNGTIYTTGDTDSIGVALASGGTFTNFGLVRTDGAGSTAVFGDGSDVSIINAIEGSIVTTGDGSNAVEVGDTGYVQNDGSIETSGAGSAGVVIGDNGLVVTNDIIATSGDESDGVVIGDSSRVFNSGTISTTGALASGIIAGSDSIVESDAVISTTGIGATGILVGDNAQVLLEVNSVLTTEGEDADALIASEGGVLRNNGQISATGAGSDAVAFGGDTIFANFESGVITGEVGIDATSNDGDLDDDNDAQTVANFGSITGTEGNAVLLGEGDDVFQQWDTGVVSGVVDGGDGADFLIFGNDSADPLTRDLGEFEDTDVFANFETFGVLSAGGAISLTGDSDISLNILGGDIVLEGSLTDTVVALGATETTSGVGSLTVTETGSIDVEEDSAVLVQSEGFAINNAGTINSDGTIAIDASGTENLTVDNSGTISTGGVAELAIFGGNNTNVTNSGLVAATADQAIAIAIVGDGTVTNTIDGTISGEGVESGAVFLAGEGFVDNDGAISSTGDASIAVALGGESTLENSGTVIATGDGTTGVLLVSGADVANEDGGEISGSIGIDATDDAGSNTISNFGSITGTSGTAVLLGDGDDEFQQFGGSSVTGTVDGGDGIDQLVFGNFIADNLTIDLSDAGNFFADDSEDHDGDDSDSDSDDSDSDSETVSGFGGDFINFETVGFRGLGGGITLTGESDTEFALVGGDITLDGTLTNTLTIEGDEPTTLNVSEDGSVDNEDGDAVVVTADGATINNSGLIRTGGGFAINGQGSNLTVNNDGDIEAAGAGSIALFAADGATVTNAGTISAGEGTDVATVIFGGGTLVNTADGEIVSDGLGGVIFAGEGVVDNDGTISATADGAIAAALGADALLLNNGSITADGENGLAVLLTGGADATNEEDGVISGTIAIDASDDDGSNTVANLGSLTGTGGTAVLLGDGDDEFQQFDASSVDGTVDGGDGTDRLVFANAGADPLSIDVSDASDVVFGEDHDDSDSDSDDSDGDESDGDDSDGDDSDTPAALLGGDFINFETVGFRGLGGGIVLTGESATSFDLLGGSITLDGTLTNTVNITESEEPTVFAVSEDGAVDVADGDAVFVQVDGATIVNAGLIQSGNEQAIEASSVDVTIDNTGTISTTDNHAIALNSGTITNAGLIESLSTATDMDGDMDGDSDGMDDDSDGMDGDSDGMDADDSDSDVVDLEPAFAAISFEGESELASEVTNLAGGIIRGEVGIVAWSDDDDDDNSDNPDRDRQLVANFGTIEGTDGNAVLLGDGDDEFQQWTGATTIGNIDLEDGNDTFILEGRLSSIDGSVIGGDGDDTAILVGILDTDDIFEGFETLQLGSTLPGTLADLEVEGDRTLEGDFVIGGPVNFDLGVDSITTDGTITLAPEGVVNVATPLNRALVGQTVAVLVGEGEEDLGGTINVIDDDQLLNYIPVGLLSVEVETENVLADDTDRNLRRLGVALTDGIDNDTISDDLFDDFNDLPTVDAFREAARDALPSLSEAVGREIFETAGAASRAIAHPLARDGGAVWGQVMYRGADRDARALSQAGYESEQLIFTGGVDFISLESVQFGVIGSYADIDNDDIDRDGALRGTSEVESIKVGGYASASFMDRGFVSAEVSYLTGNVEEDRNGFFGPIGSEYDFDGYFASATFGYDLAAADNVGIIPSVGIQTADINFDDSVETGGIGFGVARGDAEFTELRGGLEVNGDISSIVRGFASATYIHDIEDSERSFSLTSTDLAPINVHLPEREQDRFEVAAGLIIGLSEGLGIDLGYHGDFANGYSAHAARANLRFAF